jgi:hypothetical protein
MICSRIHLLPVVALSLLAIHALQPIAHAGTVSLPKTGQQTCWDSSGNVQPCFGAGQDGNLRKGEAWPTPRFTQEAQTITDNLTGLVWTKDANIIKVKDPDFDNDGVAGDGLVTWQHSLEYVEKLNQDRYMGHDDWRLPNIRELKSLVNYSEPVPSEWLKSAEQGFVNVEANYYWSSTSSALSLDQAWVVGIWFGESIVKNKSGNLYVWPVRAGR